MRHLVGGAVPAVQGQVTRRRGGDDGRRWNETNVTNANELDEGVGRTTRPRVWTQENRQLRPLPSPQPHFPHPSRALLRTSRRRRARARELEDLERLATSTFHIASLAGSLAEIPEALCREGAGRPRPSRARGGDERCPRTRRNCPGAWCRGRSPATIRASMGVGRARLVAPTPSTGWARAVVQEKARAVVRGAHDDSLHPRLLELREARGCGEVENRPAVRARARQAPASEDGMRASDSDKKRVAISARWGRARARTSLRRA